jgi:hypothetical protein
MRRARRHQRGATLVAFVIAALIGFVVLLALGRIALMNGRAWEWGRDKAVLQANATEAIEWIARSVRSARTLLVVSASEFDTYDASGTLVHTYKRDTVDGEPRLLEDGGDLIDRRCVQFVVTPDEDTTSVRLLVEVEDEAGNRVAVETRATVRNIHYAF